MNPFRLLLLLLLLATAPLPAASGPDCRLDSLGRFAVTAEVPAGQRHAILELSSDLSGAPWRKMLACATDGTAARVTFRLPVAGVRGFARVVTGPEAQPPPVELDDPDLVTTAYGDPVPEAVKIQFLTAAGGKMREWKSLPWEEYLAHLIAWAKASPEVAEAEISGVAGNVSIHFTDGDICVLLNRPRSSADAGLPQPPATGVSLVAGRGTKSIAIGSLPGSNRAVTAFSLESKFPNSAPTIGGWLSSRGYEVANFGTTSVQQVIGWAPRGNPLGALFWHAHGCSYKKADGTEGIGIITRESTGVTHPVYGEMRENGELMLAIDEGDPLPVYGITSKFIRQRMHFAPHSVVVLDACCGAHPDLGNAFIAAGAGTFVSWDWLSGDMSGTPCLKIFDRLLGTNSEPPISVPAERSFAIGTVQAWMTLNHYDEDPSPHYKDQTRSNAKLVWYHHPSQPANILLPSVMRVLAEAGDDAEPFSKYLIEGDFGPDPGSSKRSVLWGGQDMNVLRWDPLDGITIRVPAHPPRGDIQVVLSKDYYSYSNKVPMTEWQVPFTYEVVGQGSLGARMDLNVRFRGDIHGSRGMPEMEPQYLPVVFTNMADCTGSITAGGTWHVSQGNSLSWSGGSTLTSRDWNAGGTGVLDQSVMSNGVLLVKAGTAPLFSLQASGRFTETERWIDDNGGVHEQVRESVLGLDSVPFLLSQPLSFNPATGRLASGNRSIWGDTETAVLSWPAVTPAPMPTDATPR
ncbi:hypothetical protein [Haloferula sargassicola]|uniref:Uncharacterized protein n=1 Tax=Haloferula sargassicola TaxID=490096 RepID=A0ABP9UPN8_9BACT